MDDKFSTINSVLNKEEEGIEPRLKSCVQNVGLLVDQVESDETRLSELQEFTATIHSNQQYLQGVIQKQDREITWLKDKVVSLKAKSLANSIVIHGLEGDKAGEEVNATVIKFLKERMKMELYDDEIYYAARQGQKIGKKPRKILVHCAPSLRSRIFNYTHHLKGVRNECNDFYYVNQMYPEKYQVEAGASTQIQENQSQNPVSPSRKTDVCSNKRSYTSIGQCSPS